MGSLSNGNMKMQMKQFYFCRNRKNLDKSRIEADEKAVLDVVKTLKLMINPFDNEHEDLVHLASGTVASSAVSDDMTKWFFNL